MVRALLFVLVAQVGGAVFTLAFMGVGYVFFDRLTPFDTGAELHNGNVAVGLVVGSIFVGWPSRPEPSRAGE